MDNLPNDILSQITEHKYMSDEIDQIVAALCKARLEMPVPKKSKSNHRGPYSDLLDYLNASVSSLAKNGILLYPHTRTDENLNIIVHSTLMHVSGQWLDSRLPANPIPALEEAKMEAEKSGKRIQITHNQAVSSALTYAKRQMIQAQLSLGADTEDDYELSQQDNDIITIEQAIDLGNLLSAKGISVKTVLESFKKEDLRNLTFKEYKGLMENL